MTEAQREQVALFRYGIIAPILNGQVSNLTRYFIEQSSKTHDVPCYGIKEYSYKTFEAWLKDYRRDGFDGLKPGNRSDKGIPRKISNDLEAHLVALRKEQRLLPVSIFYNELVSKGEILPSDISYPTLYRVLKKYGLVGKDPLSSPERKRFSYDKVNALWQGDISDGPYINVSGVKKQAFLFAFIDDCSRLVPYAQFFFSEKFDSLRTVFKEALLRRGIPNMLYVDNGKVYRSQVLQIACATLGITLIHTQPYDAASKGKIERFFGTVKTCFLPLLRQNPVSSLEELNQRFWKWLEEDYHRKLHSGTGRPPLDLFMSQAAGLRLVSDPSSLDPLFLKRDNRRVKHDGTISVDNKLYEVSQRFIGQSVEVRFDDDGVYIYEDGKAIEKAVPVNFSDNTRVKRDKGLSFKDM